MPPACRDGGSPATPTAGYRFPLRLFSSHFAIALKRNYKALVTRADAQTFWKTVATFKPAAPSAHAGSTVP